MFKDKVDTLGQIVWFAIPFTPLFTIPIICKLSNSRKIYRILWGLGLELIMSLILYLLSISIVFRNGMGASLI
ncbi:hypothetical protein SAMN05216294_0179 [Flagellimonas zhangzhouensis]|uniref:Uncharacterized protein n=1 Tax=Flagellimonas zhangzhouensis TaxID=1073328 RepID=A0A1H2VL21_9FLAO|nr:hypothetical protein SAMN05216294_0179 [Allomuricauda zhangzhouensis]SDW68674.1 hypothetical protein SAMN04487892_2114 [Allomuricauda zhangzhouensis]